MEKKFYSLPNLPYAYNALAPHVSEEQLKIHHSKHHQAYVDNTNAILRKFDSASQEGVEIDVKGLAKELSFNLGGHTLHSCFWLNMAPPGKGGGAPGGRLADAIDKDFGSFDKFKKVFSQAAASVEGSGWGALAYSQESDRLLIMQIEKHNVNVIPNLPLLMVLDVWEHAYYLDYKNMRAKFVEAFWSIVNWDEIGKWFDGIRKR